MGSENVFNILALGRQSGTFDAPGSAVAATFLFPVEGPVGFELDRAPAFPKNDRGRNVRNNRGSGYLGVREASASPGAQLRFNDIMDFLEMHYAGNITPASLGGGLYRWDYPFEALAPTLVPYTLEGGNVDNVNAQMRLVSSLVSSLTLSFPGVAAGQASPWTLAADVMAFDREISELTDPLTERSDLEVAMGHLTRLYEGDTSVAFASLPELVGHLKRYTQTTQRSLIPRAYGSDSDLATAWGFSDTSNGTFEMDVAVSTDSKTDFHDIWNVTSPASIGEKRIRLVTPGNGGKSVINDVRAGLMAVPLADQDGERLFNVKGEMVDDDALEAMTQLSITNTLASLS